MEAKKAPLTRDLGLAESSPPARAESPRLCEDNELDFFDEAWQKGAPPDIAAYLPDVPPEAHPVAEATRRGVLHGLIKIDLEYRWRLGSVAPTHRSDILPAQPLLDDYVRAYPELESLDRLPVDLIGEEYRVRQLWGNRPGHDEFRKRFPSRGANLEQALAGIDAELQAERVRDVEMAAALALPAKSVTAGISTATFLETLRDTGLLTPAQLLELAQETDSSSEPAVIGRAIVEHGWLTPYQVEQILVGRGPDLFLGAYLVLDLIGQGGTGNVFKARHQRMNRVVALKVLHPELLADPEVVSRFYREMHLVAKLSNPHVVHAFDAGPIGPTHYLVMEYFEGIDLWRLVHESGPLPEAKAAEYIRQAAIGLQHFHEHQLVHRDIKPSNLLLTQSAERGALGSELVKLLDLGLARWRPNRADQSDGNVTGIITPAGSVTMGTPDYLAPEQARDFHAADIRADLYSLGCTFYFLLTGHAPFAGGTLAQKLLQHQQDEPPPIERFRPEISAGTAALVRKLMAKRPEERCQSPAELVAELERQWGDHPEVNLSSSPLPGTTATGQMTEVAKRPADFTGAKFKRRRWLLGAGSVLAAGILLIGIQPWMTGPKQNGLPVSAPNAFLHGNGSDSAAEVNLTLVGVTDWIHWGKIPGSAPSTNAVRTDRKASGASQISDYAPVGSGSIFSYDDDPRPLSWSDGSPDFKSSGNNEGVAVFGAGNGFSISVPADTTSRTLTVLVGGWRAHGQLVAHLSDGSAPDFTSTTKGPFNEKGQFDHTFSLTYQAASPGQKLTVTWTLAPDGPIGGGGNVTLSGAALSKPK